MRGLKQKYSIRYNIEFIISSNHPCKLVLDAHYTQKCDDRLQMRTKCEKQYLYQFDFRIPASALWHKQTTSNAKL